MWSRPLQRAFTLVELAICVSIVAILAAIAVPMVKHAVYDARLAEAHVNLGDLERTGTAIMSAESQDVFWDFDGGWYDPNNIYFAALFMPCFPHAGQMASPCYTDPGGPLGSKARPWVASAEWSLIGWSPDGDVRCSYQMELQGDVAVGHDEAVWCDVDGDGDTLLVLDAHLLPADPYTYRFGFCTGSSWMSNELGGSGWPGPKIPCY